MENVWQNTQVNDIHAFQRRIEAVGIKSEVVNFLIKRESDCLSVIKVQAIGGREHILVVQQSASAVETIKLCCTNVQILQVDRCFVIE